MRKLGKDRGSKPEIHKIGRAFDVTRSRSQQTFKDDFIDEHEM